VRVLLVTLLALLVLLALCVREARADGDPASDVLVEQALFLPWDADLSSTQQATLQALLESSRRSADPLRVALIASSTDLGSVTPLWRKPQAYAEFLGDELSLTYRGPLLIVMPNGFGLEGFGAKMAAVEAALTGIDAPAPGAGLGQVALTAVHRIAGVLGETLAVSASEVRAASRARAPSAGPVPWIAFIVGLAVVLAAWALSLRAAPPRFSRRQPTPS
jgi:hypothetical protein